GWVGGWLEAGARAFGSCLAHRSQSSATPLSAARICHSSVRAGRTTGSSRATVSLSPGGGSAPAAHGAKPPTWCAARALHTPRRWTSIRRSAEPAAQTYPVPRLKRIQFHTRRGLRRKRLEELGPLLIRQKRRPRQRGDERRCDPVPGDRVKTDGDQQPCQHTQRGADRLLPRAQAEEQVGTVAAP